MTPKERVIAALAHREADRVPTGEFATDHSVIREALGRPTFWRAKRRYTEALWEGRRDEVVESMKRDIVDFTLALGLDMVPVHAVPHKDFPFRKPRQVDDDHWEDEQGNILGSHQGIINYTIGQRRGLGIAASEPLYVIAIEPEHNAIIVGSQEHLLGDELVATDINWSAIEGLTEPITARAKIRYRHPEANVIITPVDKDDVYVKFKRPQPAITPGQAIVFYDGDIVLGGGKIASSGKSRVTEQAKEYASNG